MADDQQQSGRSPEERPGQSPSPAPSGPEAESPAASRRPRARRFRARRQRAAMGRPIGDPRRPRPGGPARAEWTARAGGSARASAGACRPRRGSALPIALAFVAIAVLVAASVVAYAAASLGATSPAGRRPHRALVLRLSAVYMTPGSPVAGRTTVRWFVGLGSGTDNYQIDAQKAFVANYDATNNDGISIQLEIVPNNTAYDVLKTEIEAGNAPDNRRAGGRSGSQRLRRPVPGPDR